MPITKRLSAEERKKKKEEKAIVAQIQDKQEMLDFVWAGVSLEGTQLKNLKEKIGQNPLAKRDIEVAERKYNKSLSVVKAYQSEIQHLKDSLKILNPDHKLLQPKESKARQHERKHSHQKAMGAEAPKVKVKSPDTHQKQVSLEDLPEPTQRKLK